MEYAIHNSDLDDLAGEVQDIREFFDNARIPVILQWFDKKKFYKNKAHLLAMKALINDEGDYKAYLYQDEINTLIKKGILVVPLSVFRRSRWSKLTISEALVMELIEKRKLTIAQTARELNRAYNTIRTQYERAKKKIR